MTLASTHCLLWLSGRRVFCPSPPPHPCTLDHRPHYRLRTLLSQLFFSFPTILCCFHPVPAPPPPQLLPYVFGFHGSAFLQKNQFHPCSCQSLSISSPASQCHLTPTSFCFTYVSSDIRTYTLAHHPIPHPQLLTLWCFNFSYNQLP